MDKDATAAKMRREARRLLDEADLEKNQEAKGLMLRHALELAAKAEIIEKGRYRRRS
jgi:hypothetical protein